MTTEDITRATGLSKKPVLDLLKRLSIEPIKQVNQHTAVYESDTAERILSYIANRNLPVAFEGYAVYASSMNY